MNNNKYISIGKILNFHGLKGDAKLGYSKNREDFLRQISVLYVLYNNAYTELSVEYIKFTPKTALVKFKGLDNLNDIAKYKGCLLFVKEDVAREHLEEDEFLIDELVGLDIYDNDVRKGVVVGVSNNGASDLLSVKTLSKKICLVPFVKAIVTSVDIKSKRIQINNIEGLLE